MPHTGTTNKALTSVPHDLQSCHGFHVLENAEESLQKVRMEFSKIRGTDIAKYSLSVNYTNSFNYVTAHYP